MIKDKFKFLLEKKENEPSKKKVENLVVFIIILIITLITINVIWNGDDKSNDTQKLDPNKKLAQQAIQRNGNSQEVSAEIEDKLVIDLENILSKINGVGKVQVMVTYGETSKIQPVYNEESTEEKTEEKDTQGGTRKVTQTDSRKEVIYEEKDGEKTLVTQSTISPKIEGAIITAEGANDATVKTNIIQAVEAVTGLATHKIQVFKMVN